MNKIEKLDEFVSTTSVVQNPQPPIVRGGDCGACVMAGILDKSVQEIYDLSKDGTTNIDWYSMEWLANKLYSENILLDYNSELPPTDEYENDQLFMAFRKPAWKNSLNWYKNVKHYLNNGYLGIANVAHNKDGHETGETDHWVLITGWREETVRLSEVCSRIDQYVGVSCSSKATPDFEWVNKKDMLKYRGGYNIIFVKQKTIKL